MRRSKFEQALRANFPGKQNATLRALFREQARTTGTIDTSRIGLTYRGRAGAEEMKQILKQEATP